MILVVFCFFFSSRRRHTRFDCDWSSDVCSSDLELPQLWNIFSGDMSFVGPRALMPEEIELSANGERVPLTNISGFTQRHSVRPGLTGIAQVYASRDIPRREKFKYDLLYIKRQSFLLDIKLIAVSFWITFRGKWESRAEK